MLTDRVGSFVATNQGSAYRDLLAVSSRATLCAHTRIHL